jgi:hypothetical protein
MVRYGLARSRSHAFNILIEKGLNEVMKEIGFWEQVYRDVEELEESGFKIAHGGLSKMLEEERYRCISSIQTSSYHMLMRRIPTMIR